MDLGFGVHGCEAERLNSDHYSVFLFSGSCNTAISRAS